MTRLPNRNEERALIPVPLWGLNTKDDASQMSPLFASDLSNVMADDPKGINKRSGMTLFNTGMMPVTLTGSITSITSQSVSGATGVVWSDVVTAGYLFKMASGTNIYKISGLNSNATLNLTADYSDTVTTGSYYIGPPAVYGLNTYTKGTTQKLIGFGGGTFFDGGSSATGEFTNKFDALTSGKRVSSVTFQDVLLYCNGYEFQTWDGTTIAAVGGSPAPADPKFVDVYSNGSSNWVVIGGSETDADRSELAFSDVNTNGTWPAANRYQVSERDGGAVLMGKQTPNGYLVFKDNGIFMFGGIPGSSGSLKRISNIGCPCPWSVVSYENQVYFVGTREGRVGVFKYIGGNSIISIADFIEPTLNGLKVSALSQVCGEIYNEKYYISGTSSSGTYNDRHFVCYINRPFRTDDGRLGYPWFKGNRGFNFLKSVTISGAPYLFSGSPTSGYVYREENGTSDDTTDNIFGNAAAIDAYITTKNFDLGDPTVQKELLRGNINVNAVGAWNINLDLYRDFQTYGYTRHPINIDTETSLWSQVVFGVTPWQTATGKNIDEVLFAWPSMAYYFKFRWANANADEYFTVFPMNIYFKREGR